MHHSYIIVSIISQRKLFMIRLLFLFLLQALIAQPDFQMPGSGIILGEVINADSGMPVEYASITLINIKSSEIEMGQLSDQNGIFIFKEVKNGDYFVEIKFMGYETWKSKELNINSSFTKPTRKDLNLIQLKTKVLEGQSVNITDQKEMYEFEADKLVYNPDKDIIAASGSAEDVLNRTPMVTVDQDGGVQLRGQDNVNILVDGRKNRMDLANISGSQIERVEVITSASAKYDPEGMAGIINIVLKKGTTDGFNGNIQTKGQHNAYHSFDEMHGINGYANYQKGDWNFFGNFGISNRFSDREGYRNTSTTYTSDDENITPNPLVENIFYTYRDSTARSKFNIRFGLDYYTISNITLTNEFKFSNNKKIIENIQTYTQPDRSSKLTLEEEDPSNYDFEYLFALDKEYKDPDQKLDFSINLDFGDRNKTSSQLNSNNEILYLTDFLNDYFGAEIDLLYKTPLSEASKLEFGYDGNITDNENIMIFDGEVLGVTNEGMSYIGKIENQFNFKRNIHAFFLEYDTDLSNHWSLKPSARIEYVNRKVIFKSDFNVPSDNQEYNMSVLDDLIENANNNDYILDRFEIYPFLNLTYNISKNQNIQFGFGRRVKRPGGGDWGSWSIMPFPDNIYNQDFIFIGNPYLKPEYSTQYDINYSSPIPMGFASINLFYHDISNKFEWYDDDSFPSGNVLTFENVSNAYSRGINLFGMIMGQTLGGGYTMTTQVDNNNPDDYELNEQSERFYIFNRIKFPEKYIKIFDFEFGFYWMKMKLPSGSLFGNKGTAWGDLGISKNFLDKKLTVSFTIDNIFDSGGFQMKRTKPIIYIPDGYDFGEEFSDVFNRRNGRTLKVTLKYQIGKKTSDKKKGFGRDGDSDGGGMMDMGY